MSINYVNKEGNQDNSIRNENKTTESKREQEIEAQRGKKSSCTDGMNLVKKSARYIGDLLDQIAEDVRVLNDNSRDQYIEVPIKPVRKPEPKQWQLKHMESKQSLSYQSETVDVVEETYDLNTRFYLEIKQISHLLEPTYLTVKTHNEVRAKVFCHEWEESFTTINSKALKYLYKQIDASNELNRLEKWLDVIYGYNIIRCDKEEFNFTSEDDNNCFSNGGGYVTGDQVKLLQNYWYTQEENGHITLVAKGLIDTADRNKNQMELYQFKELKSKNDKGDKADE